MILIRASFTDGKEMTFAWLAMKARYNSMDFFELAKMFEISELSTKKFSKTLPKKEAVSFGAMNCNFLESTEPLYLLVYAFNTVCKVFKAETRTNPGAAGVTTTRAKYVMAASLETKVSLQNWSTSLFWMALMCNGSNLLNSSDRSLAKKEPTWVLPCLKEATTVSGDSISTGLMASMSMTSLALLDVRLVLLDGRDNVDGISDDEAHFVSWQLDLTKDSQHQWDLRLEVIGKNRLDQNDSHRDVFELGAVQSLEQFNNTSQCRILRFLLRFGQDGLSGGIDDILRQRIDTGQHHKDSVRGDVGVWVVAGKQLGTHFQHNWNQTGHLLLVLRQSGNGVDGGAREEQQLVGVQNVLGRGVLQVLAVQIEEVQVAEKLDNGHIGWVSV
ncbi:hypothetical protein WICPIJ_007885 [Wickerhamomyces pijperi]|uniref:Uncharacterized protein n=1 Tax=Wickerhamomyces pijperi TaxID=599730 RepID=A0A9P8Q0X6_WICPI|nr:hypothetical protein WICPIJ_007885 [Wickerhamomyces pijperi]